MAGAEQASREQRRIVVHMIERRAVDAISAATVTHENVLGLYPSSEPEINAWQLIASMLDYCAANDIDFDATVKDIRENYHFND